MLNVSLCIGVMDGRFSFFYSTLKDTQKEIVSARY